MSAPVPDEASRVEAAPSARVDLKALTYDELSQWLAAELGAPRFRAEQIFRWMHGRRARSWDEMTNLPKAMREALAARACIGGLELDEVLVARDGTRKLLLRRADGNRIESVLIPMEDRITQCVSSQVGCKIGCDFCLTARMPLRKNLLASEIADQVYWAQRVLGEAGTGQQVNNIVYMGMGEPLDNYEQVVRSLKNLIDERGANFSGRRITVSTSGVVPKIPQLGADVPVNLAVSLNATTDEMRTRLIPINKRWNIQALMEALHAFPLQQRRRITVEYVMLGGVNDTLDDARRLVRLLRGLRCKVNLIPFNPWPGSPYLRPDEGHVEAFGAVLRDAHYTVTIRYSKGEDIGAACGQLDGKAEAA